KDIRIGNISQWRRTICGDLTSTFSPFDGKEEHLPFLQKDQTIEKIYSAKYKQLPNDYHKMRLEQAVKIGDNLRNSSVMPKQEKGTKASCALRYELYVDGNLKKNKTGLEVEFSVGNQVFGKKASGAPFLTYTSGEKKAAKDIKTRQYAVAAGDNLK